MQSLGESLPSRDSHAVSVSLPMWKDTEAWANRDAELLSKLKTGYPRFFVPRQVQDLAKQLLESTTTYLRRDEDDREDGTGSAVYAPFRGQHFVLSLFPSFQYASMCKDFLQSKDQSNSKSIYILHVDFVGNVSTSQQKVKKTPRYLDPQHRYENIYGVTYPKFLAREAKEFWQHTGYGISSRCAEYWLEQAPFLRQNEMTSTPTCLLLAAADEAKTILRCRIADSLSTASSITTPHYVFLYQSGMAAISSVAAAARALHGHASRTCRVVIFGFLYVDTMKLLSNVYSYDCIFYGHCSDSELDTFEAALAEGAISIDALFTEFPTNPLLITPNLERLHRLSQQYNFLLVVDDTLATAVNVTLFPSCDVVCTSLTKMFSGGCNVMGGSVTLNPCSAYFAILHDKLSATFEDTYFPLDAMVMEINSRDYTERVTRASQNASRVAAQLQAHPAVAQVFYPEQSTTRHLYDQFKRGEGGYGYLLSICLVSPAAAVAFHDGLDVAKGPSLGTYFTLCCPYTLLAHASELDWAASYGVIEHLVRISVGIESAETLEQIVARALGAAEVALNRTAGDEKDYNK